LLKDLLRTQLCQLANSTLHHTIQHELLKNNKQACQPKQQITAKNNTQQQKTLKKTTKTTNSNPELIARQVLRKHGAIQRKSQADSAKPNPHAA
jgi:hypothetical protein